MLKKCEVIAVFACFQQWSQVLRHQLTKYKREILGLAFINRVLVVTIIHGGEVRGLSEGKNWFLETIILNWAPANNRNPPIEVSTKISKYYFANCRTWNKVPFHCKFEETNHISEQFQHKEGLAWVNQESTIYSTNYKILSKKGKFEKKTLTSKSEKLLQ